MMLALLVRRNILIAEKPKIKKKAECIIFYSKYQPDDHRSDFE